MSEIIMFFVIVALILVVCLPGSDLMKAISRDIRRRPAEANENPWDQRHPASTARSLKRREIPVERRRFAGRRE